MKYKFNLLFISLIVLYTPFSIIMANAPKKYVPQYSNPFSESWRWRSYPELNGRGCRCMVEDNDGTLWFGVSGGVLRYDGLEWDYYSISEDSSDIPVVSLCVATDGSIYAGTSEGISKYSNNKWQKLNLNFEFGDPDEYYLNKIPIINSSDGSVWIGTKQGAVRIKDDKSNILLPKYI